MSIITISTGFLIAITTLVGLLVVSGYQRKKLKEELKHSEVWGRNHLQLLQKQNKLTLEYRDQVADAYAQVVEIQKEYEIVCGQLGRLEATYRSKIDGVDALRENNDQLRGALDEANSLASNIDEYRQKVSFLLWQEEATSAALRGANEQLQADLDSVTCQLNSSDDAIRVLQGEMEHLANEVEDPFAL